MDNGARSAPPWRGTTLRVGRRPVGAGQGSLGSGRPLEGVQRHRDEPPGQPRLVSRKSQTPGWPGRLHRVVGRREAYLPSRIKTPAAIARIAMTMGNPAKLKLSDSINPVRMSQMPSNSIPRLLVSFMLSISFV